MAQKDLLKETNKLGNRSPHVHLDPGEELLRKLAASICPAFCLLLRPVLKAGQHESTIVAQQSSKMQSITGEKAAHVGGNSALFCGPRIAIAQQRFQINEASFNWFFLKRRKLNLNKQNCLPSSQSFCILCKICFQGSVV